MSHLAVCLPEIVSHVLSFLVPTCYHDEPKKKMYTDLYHCLTVNHLWYDCATRIIWRNAFFEDTKNDLEIFLKFASVLCDTPTTQFYDIVSAGPTITFDTIMTSTSMVKYPSRSSSISSVSTFDSIHTPSECSIMDQDDDFSVNGKVTTADDFSIASSSEDLTLYQQKMNEQARLIKYQNALRFLSVRKIKEESINEPLLRIGESAPKLEYLDIYICDHLLNETLYPFLRHQSLTYLSLAGCHNITDEAILKVAEYCKGLQHLDLRACGSVSDTSLSAIALNCRGLKHLNVGRIRDREKVTVESISMIAKYTQATVLGLAGCDIDDHCMKVLASYRGTGLERVSVNSCFKITNETVYALLKYCPNLSVFEMKECHRINDWEAVAELVQRKVLLTLCDQQNRACADWARVRGRSLDVKSPLK